MTLPVTWQQSARDDLAAVIRFISEHNGYAARVETGVLSLGDSPYMGRPGRVRGTRELLLHPNYWAVYRVAADGIEITYILHSRREYP